jgi:hypothetical protein
VTCSLPDFFFSLFALLSTPSLSPFYETVETGIFGHKLLKTCKLFYRYVVCNYNFIHCQINIGKQFLDGILPIIKRL